MHFRSYFLLILSALASFTTTARADIEWSGVYRVEAYNLKNSDLDSRGKEINYGLHHLVLRPKIVAGDGLTVFGEFNILNSNDYPNSQLGSYLGAGVRDAGAGPSTSADDSNVLSRNQASGTVNVSQLYLTYNHEYGQLIVGRAPLQFGLGITYNAGRGLFDHWYSTDDLVGYKVLFGNIWVLPMIGRASEGLLQKSDDVKDYMVQFQYENPETDLEIGLFYQMRDGGNQSSDGPTSTAKYGLLGGDNATASGKVNIRTANLFVTKDTDRYRLGFEASYQTGETGVVTNAGNGDDVSLSGFALAGEFDYRPEHSKWKYNLKLGLASGDDPETDAKYEGYAFHRNYNVGMLMFDHPLGKYDVLRSRPFRGDVFETGSTVPTNAAPDVESVANALYFAPQVKYAFNERWGLDGTFVTGWVSQNPLVGTDPGKGLGYEFDVSLNYSPRKGVMWINQAGLLFPGDVWKGADYDNKYTYGLATKAAISF